MSDGPQKPPTPGAPYMGYGSFQALVDARPDLFDDFDCRPNSEAGVKNSYVPEHLRELIRARRAERAAAKKDGDQ